MFTKVKNSCVCDEHLLSDEFLSKRGKKRSKTFAKVITNFCNGEGGGKECREEEKKEIDKKVVGG